MQVNKLFDDAKNLVEVFYNQAILNPEKIAYEFARKKEPAIQRSYKEVLKRVSSIANFLSSRIDKPSNIAIISSSRAEWMESDLAILANSSVTVHIYQTLPASEIAYILDDAKVDTVFVENLEQFEKIKTINNNKFIIPTKDNLEKEVDLSIKTIISFENINDSLTSLYNYNDLLDKTGKVFDFNSISIKRGDLANIVYTSGTTGVRKGVGQTHSNHLSNLRQAYVAQIYSSSDSILIFLPFAHSFAKLMGYIGMLTDVVLKFPSVSDSQTSKIDLELVGKDIAKMSASIVPVVPRFLDKVKEKLQLLSSTESFKSKILFKALYSKNVLVRLLTFSIRAKIKKQVFGDNFKYAISGGAKLNPDTAYFFDNINILILQGYGLTETCVATNVNPYFKNKIGTVGPLLDADIELKISNESEILFRGPNVVNGYYNYKKATEESWDDDGFFHTGDLGSVDSDGYLSIVGRKKELIVSSYGKKISPIEVESFMEKSKFVSQSVLVGNDRKYCVALVVPELGLLEAEFEKGLKREEQEDFIYNEIIVSCQKLAKFKVPKKIIIISDPFSVENGLLTPTLKIRRSHIEKAYQAKIDLLYK